MTFPFPFMPPRSGVISYDTWSTTSVSSGGTASLSNGNRTLTNSGSSDSTAHARGGVSISGKMYAEVKFVTIPGANYNAFGVIDSSQAMPTTNSSVVSNTWNIGDNGTISANGGGRSASGTGSFTANVSICQIAVDVTAGKMWVGKDNTWVGDPAAGTGNSFSSLPGTLKIYAQTYVFSGGAGQLTINIDPAHLIYSPPGGFSSVHS